MDPGWIQASAALWLAIVVPLAGFVWKLHADAGVAREALSNDLRERIERSHDNLREKIEDERTALEFKLAEQWNFSIKHHQDNMGRLTSIESRLAVIEDRSNRIRVSDRSNEQ